MSPTRNLPTGSVAPYVVHSFSTLIFRPPWENARRLSSGIFHHVRERIVFLDDDRVASDSYRERRTGAVTSIDHAEYRRGFAPIAKSEGEDGDSREGPGT